jgi:hypothetical protein
LASALDQGTREFKSGQLKERERERQRERERDRMEKVFKENKEEERRIEKNVDVYSKRKGSIMSGVQ